MTLFWPSGHKISPKAEKSAPRIPPPPKFRPFLRKRVEILKFRRKHMKVHKICYNLCQNRKKFGFWPLTPPYRLKARSLENHQNDIKTLILRADNSAQNAPFVLKLDLRQLFMNIHRTKHGFWEILIFGTLVALQKWNLGHFFSFWPKIHLWRATRAPKIKISQNPCLVLWIFIKSCLKSSLSTNGAFRAELSARRIKVFISFWWFSRLRALRR